MNENYNKKVELYLKMVHDIEKVDNECAKLKQMIKSKHTHECKLIDKNLYNEEQIKGNDMLNVLRII